MALRKRKERKENLKIKEFKQDKFIFGELIKISQLYWN